MRDFLVQRIAAAFDDEHIPGGLRARLAEKAYDVLVAAAPTWCWLMEDPECAYPDLTEMLEEHAQFHGLKPGETVEVGFALEYDRRVILIDPFLFEDDQ
jgi:hypothetical protein